MGGGEEGQDAVKENKSKPHSDPEASLLKKNRWGGETEGKRPGKKAQRHQKPRRERL